MDVCYHIKCISKIRETSCIPNVTYSWRSTEDSHPGKFDLLFVLVSNSSLITPDIFITVLWRNSLFYFFFSFRLLIKCVVHIFCLAAF